MANLIEWQTQRKQVIKGGSYTFIVRGRLDPMVLQRKTRKNKAVKKIVLLASAAVFSFLWILVGISSVLKADNVVVKALMTNGPRNGIFFIVPWLNEITVVLLPLSLVLLAVQFTAIKRINGWLRVYAKTR
jgi:hypothetical protein